MKVLCRVLKNADFCADHSLTPTASGVGVFITQCKNCSNMRQFSYSKLARWVEENSVLESGEDE